MSKTEISIHAPTGPLSEAELAAIDATGGRPTTFIVGDGEAETGPLATSWHSNKFLFMC